MDSQGCFLSSGAAAACEPDHLRSSCCRSLNKFGSFLQGLTSSTTLRSNSSCCVGSRGDSVLSSSEGNPFRRMYPAAFPLKTHGAGRVLSGAVLPLGSKAVVPRGQELCSCLQLFPDDKRCSGGLLSAPLAETTAAAQHTALYRKAGCTELSLWGPGITPRLALHSTTQGLAPLLQ